MKAIIKSSVFAISAIMISNTAFSASMNSPQGSTYKSAPTKQTQTYNYNYNNDSSAANREGKVFGITAQLLGSTVAPTAGFGLTFAYHFTGNDLMQVELTDGVYNYSDKSVLLEPLKFKLSAQTAGANYKRFFGNSFYGKFGADYRKISLSDVAVGNFRYTPSEIGSAESLAASVAIGNQWQFDYFTIGCDWFGVMAPVATLNIKSNTENIKNANDKRDIEDAWNQIASVTSYQVLRFYMGATF